MVSAAFMAKFVLYMNVINSRGVLDRLTLMNRQRDTPRSVTYHGTNSVQRKI